MTFYWYSGSSFVPVQKRQFPRMIIDSFLLTDGQVRGFNLHLRRFESQVSRVLPADFDELILAVVPDTGRWFPRLEYDLQNQEIYLLLRPAPPRRNITHLATTGVIDPREKPTVKGWDLATLLALRNNAQASGFDDVLLLDDNGYPKETTTAALAWWDGDTLVTPSPQAAVLPSVTWELTRHAVADQGVPVRQQSMDITQLRHLPTMVGNALHGWTDVQWDDQTSPVGLRAAWLNGLIGASDCA